MRETNNFYKYMTITGLLRIYILTNLLFNIIYLKDRETDTFASAGLLPRSLNSHSWARQGRSRNLTWPRTPTWWQRVLEHYVWCPRAYLNRKPEEPQAGLVTQTKAHCYKMLVKCWPNTLYYFDLISTWSYNNNKRIRSRHLLNIKELISKEGYT